MLVTRQIILLAEESTYNDGAVGDPTTDAILVNSVTLSNASARMIERPVIKQTLDPLQQVFGGTMMSVQFTVEVKGSGEAGTAPEIGVALKACGFMETVSAGTSVVYSSTSEDITSCSIEAYQDGVLRKLSGCRGTVSFTMNAGELITADFTFTGHYDSHSDTALPNATYQSTVPSALINLQGLRIGTYTPKIGSLTIDTANEIVTPADITDEMGFGEVRIVSRDINGTMDPEMVLLAEQDFLQDWFDGDTKVFTTGEIGAEEGNIISVSIPQLVYRDVAQGERDNLLTDSLTFGCHESLDGTTPALTITFT
ncbi:hypothetical protein JCM19232_2642 [Vibrio ishigakensis]|uniref:Uncharacterized protein n=1 Tax=Vibrio ishigakensis TaxID=1481914 RepID=A0A0B8PGB1_9VIBR|nr:hypothetical protein JCM19232_2642 [Vibrio ishigakensis]